MAVRRGMRWAFVNGAMELSWFLAWAMFCAQLTMHRPFPFFETLGAFALAGGVTRLWTGRGWRIAAVLGVEILGFTAGALLLLHGLYFASTALWDSRWLTAFFNGAREVSEWLVLYMNLLLILVLWCLGAALARRPAEYSRTCNRFDLGLTAFFALFITKLVAVTKGATPAADDLSLRFAFSFFLFGPLAIGMARMGSASRTFLPGYRGIGVIAGFIAAVLLATSGLLLFFLPGLTATAQMGYRALAIAGRPLLSVLVTVLRFAFGPGRQPPAAAAESGSSFAASWEKLAPQTHSWWMELLGKILGWGFGGLMALATIIAAIVILYCVLKWLFSRTEGSRQRPSFPSPLATLRTFWADVRRRVLRGFRGHQKAAELYGALLGWARRSGTPHERFETPGEFGIRLAARFPALQPQIGLIVGAYHREVYGEAPLDGPQLAAANRSWRLLRSPRRWPARLKGRFAGSPSNQMDHSNFARSI